MIRIRVGAHAQRAAELAVAATRAAFGAPFAHGAGPVFPMLEEEYLVVPLVAPVVGELEYQLLFGVPDVCAMGELDPVFEAARELGGQVQQLWEKSRGVANVVLALAS